MINAAKFFRLFSVLPIVLACFLLPFVFPLDDDIKIMGEAHNAGEDSRRQASGLHKDEFPMFIDGSAQQKGNTEQNTSGRKRILPMELFGIAFCSSNSTVTMNYLAERLFVHRIDRHVIIPHSIHAPPRAGMISA